MGVVEIVGRIKEEANAEVEKIERDARDKATGMIEEATAEIEAQKRNFIRMEERNAVGEKERIIRAARLKVRKKKWEAQEEMIERVLDDALKKIKDVKKESFKGEKYAPILAGLIKEAATSISAGSGRDEEGNELEVVLSEEDADASYVSNSILNNISKEIGGVKLRLSKEKIKAVGGVLVRRKDGKIVVNNTFENRMARLYDTLREDVVGALFTTMEKE
jgi:V/A-type H+-transporting ATPase subunit E